MDGYGIYIWENRRKYCGMYVKDLKSGHGIYTWPDGSVYDGQWQSGR